MRNVWNQIREALSGAAHDYTKGSVRKAIFLLAVPMILEMIWEGLFAVVDMFYVTRVGTDAVAIVGITETVITLIYSLGIGFSMAATAMVARRIGEKNPEAASDAAIHALLVGFICSVVLGVLGVIFAKDILVLMGTAPSVIASGLSYTRIIFGTNVVIMLLFLLNGVFRGAGDAMLAMYALMIANILNIILDPIFIFGFGPIPAMGVQGAAIATSIGRGIGVLFQLMILFRGVGLIRIAMHQFRIRLETIRSLLKISAGGIFQYLIASASWIFLMRIVNEFGSEVTAGYVISIRVIIFTILPAWGISNAAATLVGQNLGAGQADRAEESVWKTGYYNAAFLLSISVVLYALAPYIIGIFTEEAVVLQTGISSLRIFCVGYLAFSYGMVISAAFNGAGDTFTPTLINFACFWCLQIPMAYVFALVLEWGPPGVFWSVAISEAVLAAVAIMIFRQGKWKKMEV
ncbi:MAG: MATE family efflux transporter [Bacteroidota bacterium]